MLRSQLSVVQQYVAIAIAIVGSRSGCSCYCCGVPVALGGKGRKDVTVTKMLIEDVSTFIKGCCLLICDPISRLLCCSCVTISVAVAIVIVGSRSGCSCCGIEVSLGGKDVMVTIILIENVLTSLLMIKDCWGEMR